MALRELKGTTEVVPLPSTYGKCTRPATTHSQCAEHAADHEGHEKGLGGTPAPCAGTCACCTSLCADAGECLEVLGFARRDLRSRYRRASPSSARTQDRAEHP